MASRIRRKFRKVNKRTSSRRPMARRRLTRARSFVSRRISRRSGSGIISTIRPMATGIGMGQIAESVSNQVAPQFSMIAGYGGAYIGGGLKGVAGKVIYDALLGRSNILGSIGLSSGSGGNAL